MVLGIDGVGFGSTSSFLLLWLLACFYILLVFRPGMKNKKMKKSYMSPVNEEIIHTCHLWPTKTCRSYVVVVVVVAFAFNKCPTAALNLHVWNILWYVRCLGSLARTIVVIEQRHRTYHSMFRHEKCSRPRLLWCPHGVYHKNNENNICRRDGVVEDTKNNLECRFKSQHKCSLSSSCPACSALPWIQRERVGYWAIQPSGGAPPRVLLSQSLTCRGSKIIQAPGTVLAETPWRRFGTPGMVPTQRCLQKSLHCFGEYFLQFGIWYGGRWGTSGGWRKQRERQHTCWPL